MLEIVSAISDGTWDTPRDNVARRVKEWGLSKTTVERMVREAAVGAEVDPETVKARRAVSLGRWGWGLERTKDEIKDLSAGDEMLPALLKVYAQMQTGWDRAAGVLDESTKIQVNVVAHPVFEAMLSSVLIAVAPYPEARAAVAAAVRAKLDVLRQPAPSLLAEGSIETTGEAA